MRSFTLTTSFVPPHCRHGLNVFPPVTCRVGSRQGVAAVELERDRRLQRILEPRLFSPTRKSIALLPDHFALQDHRQARGRRHGEVYRAEDTNLKREVAIKVLPEQFTKD
ncbi:hypothetical protein MYX84_13910 [Acidobacteria bacterium AH-259-O06]|nr:hypothetical protein [Acidobacteria bacterium AH-259-O06]